MFLNKLVERNRPFIESAINLHQLGEIPPNSYVLDLDTIQANAGIIAKEAKRLQLKVFAMSKQVGRNPPFLKALKAGGIDKYVAVDIDGARAIHKAGYTIGHIGHLVQIPQSQALNAAEMQPEYWTVFNQEKATEASQASEQAGHTQKILARIYTEGDTFYMGHEGGFPAEDILQVADAIDNLPYASFAGVTTFPALLFDLDLNDVKPTPNMTTLARAAKTLYKSGKTGIEINAPGTTSSHVMGLLAALGATQVEPGHGLTGTTPLHAVKDLPENTAALYLSEVSHFYGGKPYCFGGGLYIDPVFPEYDVQALVGQNPEDAFQNRVSATLPPPSAIDYYGILEAESPKPIHIGDTVIFGFRIQAFVTRAYVVPISGISRGKPKVEGIWTTNGERIYL